MKKQFFTYLIFSVCLVACRKHKALDDLSQYLATNFQLTPQEGNIYLFVPPNQCANCIQLDGSKLSKQLNTRLFIFSTITPKHFQNFEHFYYDKSNALSKLKFVNYANCLLLYQKNALAIINPINLSIRMDSVCKPD